MAVESIQTDKKVRVRYLMKTCMPDGTVKEHSEREFSFIYGVDRQVPALEVSLEGCRRGQKVSLDIPPSEIYGDHDPELVREIPKKGLIKQRVREGRFYRQMKKGSLVSFKVLEIRPETVLADFNRPMAGISVSLEVEVLDITDASKKEIDAAVEAQLRKGIGCE